MHEASIAQGLIETIRHLQHDGTLQGRVLTVTVAVGRMTTVVADNLIFVWDALVQGTQLDGVQLIVNCVPVRVRCRACGVDSVIEEVNIACSACKSYEVELLSGRELNVTSVEVDG